MLRPICKVVVAVTTARLSFGDLLPGELMAGTSQRPPSMYWCVGTEGLAVCPGPAMETHNGAEDMGSKLSLPGGSSTVQCPSMEEIHTAYKQRNLSRARDLLRGVCEESESSQEKGLQACPSLPGLRCWG